MRKVKSGLLLLPLRKDLKTFCQMSRVRPATARLTLRTVPNLRKNVSLAVLFKAIPLQAWTGPECSRRMRLPDFKTFDT